jgi:hypothetical protein
MNDIYRLYEVFLIRCLVNSEGHQIRMRPRLGRGAAAHARIYDQKTAFEECTTYDLELILA